MHIKFLRDAKRFSEMLLFLISPLMIIGCMSTVLALVVRYGAHRGMLDRMATVGLETEAIVQSVTPEYGWIHVTYSDRQANERYGVLETAYYPAEHWQTAQSGTALKIRYLPSGETGSDRVLLADQLERVRRYRGYISAELVVVLAVCWLGVIVYPQWLYVGIIDIGEASESRDTFVGARR